MSVRITLFIAATKDKRIAFENLSLRDAIRQAMAGDPELKRG